MTGAVERRSPVRSARHSTGHAGLFDRLAGTTAIARSTMERRAHEDAPVRALIADLELLLNTTRAVDVGAMAGCASAEGTVVDFGIPPFTGLCVSSLDLRRLEQAMTLVIRRFEPRLRPLSIEVRATPTEDAGMQNVLLLEIRGEMDSRRGTHSLAIRTEIDLETGHVRLLDFSTAR